MIIGRRAASALVVLALSSALSCSRDNSPVTLDGGTADVATDASASSNGRLAGASASPTASPSATGAPSPTATPSATAPSPATASCPFGEGTLDTHCAAMPSLHVAAVDAAITAVAQAEPDVFDLKEQSGPGQYRVLRLEAYMAGVVRELQRAGFCAEAPDLQSVQVKRDNEVSERYAIVTSSGFVRRGEGSYRESCRPAIFPVPDAAHIDAIRVAFYSIKCEDGRTPPDNAEKILPLGCVGIVTATPKDRNNRDVDPRLHGTDITWQLQQGEGEDNVHVSDFPGQLFNKRVDAVAEGYFGLCASLKGVTGCLGATVVR
jgi:hypothetical protein